MARRHGNVALGLIAILLVHASARTTAVKEVGAAMAPRSAPSNASLTAASVDSLLSPDDSDYFVEVHGGKFTLNCKQWYMQGFNLWETVEAATGALTLYGSTLPDGMNGPQWVRSAMDAAVNAGANTLRVWTSPVSDSYALEKEPGVFDETVLRGLDYVLDEARKRNLRLVLILMDNWQPGGVDTLAGWAGLSTHESFWSSSRCQDMYKTRVQKIVTRVNTINGRPYSEDPTIASWNLMNEPRCYQCSSQVQAWIRTMAAYVKSLDSRHLVTVGEEGFYASTSSSASYDPMAPGSWAGTEGQDFNSDHASSDIDYTTIHLWPNNWHDTSSSFSTRWISKHLADSAAMGKPMVLEEFGLFRDSDQRSTTARDNFFDLCYDAVLASLTSSGGAGAGALFFQYYDQGQVAPAAQDSGNFGPYGIYEDDATTWSRFEQFGEQLLQNGFGDELGAAACGGQPLATSAAPVTDCSATLVDGQAGTGYEGPGCDIDINECLRGTDRCATDAGCTNKDGGYSCTCYAGYSGDGYTCTQTADLEALKSNYTTDGSGMVACDQGTDVPYPTDAPGFAYDPFANGTSAGAYGSKAAVSVLGCMQACAMAAECDSFSYNPSQKSCFLKKKPSSNTCTSSQNVCAASDASSSACSSWQTYYGPDRQTFSTSQFVNPGTAARPPPPPAVTSNSPFTPGSFIFDLGNAFLGRRLKASDDSRWW